jgi:Uma2 family endonuclease
MATLADKPGYRKMTVEEFLELAIEGRAELEDGVLYMMAGGSVRHAAIGGNIYLALGNKLRGSRCRPFGPDLGVQTGAATVRLPDVSVYCGVDWAERSSEKLLGEPTVVVEVLSPSTSLFDQNTKLGEYRDLQAVQAIVFVDGDAERCRLVERTGPEAWSDRWLAQGEDLPLACLSATLTHSDIFAA